MSDSCFVKMIKFSRMYEVVDLEWLEDVLSDDDIDVPGGEDILGDDDLDVFVGPEEERWSDMELE